MCTQIVINTENTEAAFFNFLSPNIKDQPIIVNIYAMSLIPNKSPILLGTAILHEQNDTTNTFDGWLPLVCDEEGKDTNGEVRIIVKFIKNNHFVKEINFAAANGNVKGKKKACLVGINYPGTAAALKGCINDVVEMKSMLITKFDFLNEDIICLVDEGMERLPGSELPTAKNIVENLQKLLTGSGEGDVLVFHYSGHGSQIPSLPGKTDEYDGKEEVLVSCDMKIVTDDELKKNVDGLLHPRANLTFIADCCHSGSMLDRVIPVVPVNGDNITSSNVTFSSSSSSTPNNNKAIIQNKVTPTTTTTTTTNRDVVAVKSKEEDIQVDTTVPLSIITTTEEERDPKPKTMIEKIFPCLPSAKTVAEKKIIYKEKAIIYKKTAHENAQKQLTRFGTTSILYIL
jgi:hypothetical protein